MKKPTMLSPLLVALLGCAASPTADPPTSSPVTSSSTFDLREQLSGTPLASASTPGALTGPRPLVMSSTYWRGIERAGDSGGIRLLTAELGDDGTWVQSEVDYSVSYELLAVASRTSHAFFLAGRTRRTGKDVVEAWNIPVLPGESTTAYPPLDTPIGTPAPIGAPSVVLETPPFQLPLGRGTATPQRLLLYSGTELGGVVSLAADPEGRFVLALAGAAGDRKLFRLSIEEEGVPEILYDDIVFQFVDTLAVHNHATLGRVVRAMGSHVRSSGVKAIVLIDSDNDGNFDGREDHTPQTYVAGGYTGNVWTHDFVEYP